MKKLIGILVFLLLVTGAFSQRTYFIYLQTENEQPFFVKIRDKVLSSSGSGFLILSQLGDSSHSFIVGFPQNKWPEQKFRVDVKGKDRGYLLKNFGDKGWGLFDLQTLAVQMAVVTLQADETMNAEAGGISSFTDVLSRAANDPTLRQKPVLVTQNNPQTAIQPAVVLSEVQPPDSQAVNITEAVVKKDDAVNADLPPVNEQAQTAVIEYIPSKIKRRSESSTTEGFGLTFLDEYENGVTDTIRIMIPNPRFAFSLAKEEPKDEKRFLDINSEKKEVPAEVKENQDKLAIAEAPAESPVNEAAPQKITTTAIPANYCGDTASESDFRKLRKKMAAQSSDDNMISEAAKAFKSRCFTVAQVKHLGTLFLFDSGKYKFFDAAYTHVRDIGNFPDLQSELSDQYYINRFRAMLRN